MSLQIFLTSARSSWSWSAVAIRPRAYSAATSAHMPMRSAAQSPRSLLRCATSLESGCGAVRGRSPHTIDMRCLPSVAEISRRAAGEPSPPPRRGPLGRLHLDLLLLCLRLYGLRQHHRQHAVGKLGGDLVSCHAVGKIEAPLERSVAALGEIAVLALLLMLLPLLALEHDEIAGDGDVDVLLAHAGKLGGDLERLVVLGDVDRRHGHSGECVIAPQGLDVEQPPHRR